MKILILGVTGMLGNTVFRYLTQDKQIDVWATMRNSSGKRYFPIECQDKLIPNIDVLDNDSLVSVLADIKPDVVINCVGLIKQLSQADDPLLALPINALLPHRLQQLCALLGSRLIHISTDCVFNGRKGQYVESDISDAEDLYGKSKLLGEIQNSPNAVTLRTSIIGHELNSQSSLVDWFLSQSDCVKGYKKAIFSGLPTIELAHVIKHYVLPNKSLKGLYHVSAEAIDKYTLLNLIAECYDKKIEIEADDKVKIDRSLVSSKFREETGYKPDGWPQLIEKMHQMYKGN